MSAVDRVLLFPCVYVLSSSVQLLPEFSCQSYEFACASGDQCISSSYRCDGVFDCRDHSDEQNCRMLTSRAQNNKIDHIIYIYLQCLALTVCSGTCSHSRSRPLP